MTKKLFSKEGIKIKSKHAKRYWTILIITTLGLAKMFVQIFPWDGCHFPLQGIFPTKWSNLCLLHLLHWQADSLPLSNLGSPRWCGKTPKEILPPKLFKQTNKYIQSVDVIEITFIVGRFVNWHKHFKHSKAQCMHIS